MHEACTHFIYPVDPYTAVSNKFSIHGHLLSQTVTAMVSYDSVLCDLCGDEVCREFFGEPRVVHMNWKQLSNRLFQELPPLAQDF